MILAPGIGFRFSGFRGPGLGDQLVGLDGRGDTLVICIVNCKAVGGASAATAEDKSWNPTHCSILHGS